MERRQEQGTVQDIPEVRVVEWTREQVVVQAIPEVLVAVRMQERVIVQAIPESLVTEQILEQVIVHENHEDQVVPRMQEQVVVHVIPDAEAVERAPRVSVLQMVPQFVEPKRINVADGTELDVIVYRTVCGVWEELETEFRVEPGPIEAPLNEYTGEVNEIGPCSPRSKLFRCQDGEWNQRCGTTPCSSYTGSGARCVFCCNRRNTMNIVCDFQVKVDSQYNLLEYADHENTWLWLALDCSDEEQQVKIGVEVCFNGVRHELQMFRLEYGALTDGQGGCGAAWLSGAVQRLRQTVEVEDLVEVLKAFSQCRVPLLVVEVPQVLFIAAGEWQLCCPSATDHGSSWL